MLTRELFAVANLLVVFSPLRGVVLRNETVRLPFHVRPFEPLSQERRFVETRNLVKYPPSRVYYENCDTVDNSHYNNIAYAAQFLVVRGERVLHAVVLTRETFIDHVSVLSD